MVPNEIYLDNNATTRPLPEVRQALLHALDATFGDPSSDHSAGERARTALRTSRASVAALLGVEPETLIFTSGTTESNNLVLASALTRASATQQSGTRPRLITTSVEHSSVLNVAEHYRQSGIDVVVLPVNSSGHLDLQELEQALTPATVLVSIQWANNETGVIQPIAEIGRLCRQHGIVFHTDAAQAVGKIPLQVASLPIDFLSCTAHKLHGPAGIGALYVRNRRTLAPQLHGGPQEHELRPGTENLLGIVGFGVAAAVRQSRFAAVQQHCCTLRDRFESLVQELVPDVTVNGDRAARLDTTTNLCFAGIDGQALVARLDQHGIRCSQSSACTNQRPEPSYVLRAMGLTEAQAYASVRFSVSELNTLAEIETAAAAIADLCRQQRVFRARLQSPAPSPMEVC